MGFHKMSDELIWGDDQGEIAREAIAKINSVFLEHFERPVRRAELYFGFICAITSYLDEERPRKPMKILYPDNPPSKGEKD